MVHDEALRHPARGPCRGAARGGGPAIRQRRPIPLAAGPAPGHHHGGAPDGRARPPGDAPGTSASGRAAGWCPRSWEGRRRRQRPQSPLAPQLGNAGLSFWRWPNRRVSVPPSSSPVTTRPSAWTAPRSRWSTRAPAPLLLVNDGSTDATEARLRALAAERPGRTTCCRWPGTRARQCARGCRALAGQSIVSYFDADLSTPVPEILRRRSRTGDRRSGAGLARGPWQRHPPQGGPALGAFRPIASLLLQDPRLRHPVRREAAAAVPALLAALEGAVPVALGIRRRAARPPPHRRPQRPAHARGALLGIARGLARRSARSCDRRHGRSAQGPRPHRRRSRSASARGRLLATRAPSLPHVERTRQDERREAHRAPDHERARTVHERERAAPGRNAGPEEAALVHDLPSLGAPARIVLVDEHRGRPPRVDLERDAVRRPVQAPDGTGRRIARSRRRRSLEAARSATASRSRRSSPLARG